MNSPKDTSHFLCNPGTLKQRLEQIDPARYDKTRNNLDGAVTWLSPFVTHGVLSTVDIANAVLSRHSAKTCYRLLYELAWREYFHRVWQLNGDKIFCDMHSPSPSSNAQLPLAVVNASTGIHAIDKSLRELTSFGFMHNHARMWTAALCCNMGNTHWLSAAKWMHYHLLDGDLASNTLSWQWIAGTFSKKRYVANQENVNKYSQFRQQGTFLDVSYDQLAKFERPAELAETINPELIQTIPGDTITQLPQLNGTVAVRSIWQLDALHWASFIPNVHIINGTVTDLQSALINATALRQDYTACDHWCKTTDSRVWLYPQPQKAFNSFSQFWKQVRNAG